MSQIEAVSKYIIDNHIKLEEISLGLYKDNDKGEIYKVVEEKENNLLFDIDFHLILSDDEIETKKDYYIFEFGGVVYYIKESDWKNPKLNILRYVGKHVSPLQIDTEFCHLGVHGMNELLNGCQKYDYWCKKANYLGIDTLGICEKHSLGSILKFQKICRKYNIKPIFGEEITVSINDKLYVIKIYAKGDLGWKNLINISNILKCSKSGIEKGYLDEHILHEFHKDLIFILPNNYPLNSTSIELWKNKDVYFQIDTVEILNKDAYYTYLNNIKNYLYKYSGKIPPILIGDSYYLDQEDKKLQSILNKISGNNEFKFSSRSQHFKSVDEHYNTFKEFWKEKPQVFEKIFYLAANNTKEIANKCSLVIERETLHLPVAKIDGIDSNYNLIFLNQIIDDAMEKYGFRGNPKYEERLKEEYRTIVGADLENYFLILWDIVNHCKKVDNYIGFGRGSAAGSLIAYLIGITKLNPFDYDLLFSRFLNAGRVAKVVYDIELDGKLEDKYTGIFKLDILDNFDKPPYQLSVENLSNDGKKITKITKRYEGHVAMPDIDIDIENREEVKKYLINKYGADKFAVIGSYNTFKIKAAIKDLCRVLPCNLDYAGVNALTNGLFFKEGKDAFFEELFRAAQSNSFLKNFIFENPSIVNTMYWVIDTPKSTSVHPCACVLIPENESIFDVFPMFGQGGEYICEWEGEELDSLGFLKEDLLGLSQLEFLHNIINLIKENKNITLDPFKEIPLDDMEVYKHFQNGWNSEIFQLNSYLLVNYCKQLKPSNIEDLIASIALVRPGTMNSGSHIKYVKRKNGDESVDYHFGFEEHTNYTYGLMVYQEQMMSIGAYLGNLSLEEADEGLRKGVGKKILDKILKYKDLIIKGAVEKGCSEKEASEIWDLIVEFAGYAFNKSHSACYATLGYISQWLKVHYPIEFWTAAFEKANDSSKRKEKFNQYFLELKESKSNITVVSPDINSASNKTANDNDSKIYFPLNNIKYLSDGSVESILAERKRNGKFYSFSEFLQRMCGKERLLDERELKNLVLSGVFDDIEDIKIPIDRKRLIIEIFNFSKKDYRYFFLDPFQNDNIWWSLKQWELLGVTDMDYLKICNKFFNRYLYLNSIRKLEDKQKVTFCGIILDIDVKKTKKDRKDFCIVSIENDGIAYNLVLWNEDYEQYKDNLIKFKGQMIVFEGLYSKNDSNNTYQFTLIEDSIPLFLGSDGTLLEKPKSISCKKTDKVKLKDGTIGVIIEYPSNIAISIEIEENGRYNGKIRIIDKFEIEEVFES